MNSSSLQKRWFSYFVWGFLASAWFATSSPTPHKGDQEDLRLKEDLSSASKQRLEPLCGKRHRPEKMTRLVSVFILMQHTGLWTICHTSSGLCFRTICTLVGTDSARRTKMGKFCPDNSPFWYSECNQKLIQLLFCACPVPHWKPHL